MNTTDEVLALQRKIEASAFRVDEVLDRAGIDRSTWTRWKAGATVPRLDSWRAMEGALDSLVKADGKRASA